MTAIVLCGGKSQRMGQNKALMKIGSKPMVVHLVDQLRPLFQEILISVSAPDEYTFLSLPLVVDIFPQMGSLGGVYSGLVHSQSHLNFVIACDTPFIKAELIEYLRGYAPYHDVVIPESNKGMEPLWGFYSKNCLEPMEKQLREGNLRIYDLYPSLKVKVVSWREIEMLDPLGLCFLNINTQEEYEEASAMMNRGKE